jgi:phosphoglycerate dehydrogenase-like enzyme
MVKVVAFHELEDEDLHKIAAVSSQVRLRVGVSARRLAEKRPSSSAFPPEDIERLLPEAEVLFGFRLVDDLLRKAPRLKWLHFASAGVDRAVEAGLMRSDLILTTSSGIHATPIGEYVLASMLMFTHRFHQALRQQAAHVWQRYEAPELRDRTLGIVGYGHIGREVARLGLAFGMKVVAIRRGAPAHSRRTTRVTILKPEQLPLLLAESDYVLLSVPLIDETHHMLGEKELRAMKPTAYLVNISRGKVVDEMALVRALREGWIAGAGLDVFEQEPLPGESPLWSMENVIMTPHIAGSHERYNERATELFCENLRRYLGGNPLLNLVEKTRGY